MRVTVDEGVALEVDARGEGPGLFLVHGFGGAKEDFGDHLDALARRYRVVVFDHRGHGASDGPDDPDRYTLERLAADTLAVADALGLETFRLLGHSMGGMVAQRVVLAHPERVDALVLMDTAPGPVPGIDPELMEAAAKIVLEDGKDALKPLLDAAATLDTVAHQRLLAEREGFQEFEDYKWDTLAAAMGAGAARDMARQEDRLADLAGVRCPTLVIVGEEDRPFVAASRAMASTIPGATLAVIPGAGHSPQFENPEPWLRALTEFLARVDGEAGT
jgi:pimeloyl-ACP methyl ester carboxylesterase